MTAIFFDGFERTTNTLWTTSAGTNGNVTTGVNNARTGNGMYFNYSNNASATQNSATCTFARQTNNVVYTGIAASGLRTALKDNGVIFSPLANGILRLKTATVRSSLLSN